MRYASYATVRDLARRLPRQDQAALISELAEALVTVSVDPQAATQLTDPDQLAAALAELRAAFSAAPTRAADQLATDRAERQAQLEG